MPTLTGPGAVAGNLYLGYGAGSFTSLGISGGDLDITGTFAMSTNDGSGSLTMDSGGTLSAANASIAVGAPFTFSVLSLSGPGTEFNIDGSTNIGDADSVGVGLINSGATFSTGSTTLGSASMSLSNAGSVWNATSLFIGSSGFGQVEVSDGALLDVTNGINIGQGYLLVGGAVAGIVTSGDGIQSGLVDFTHTQAAYHFGSILSGSATITQEGIGGETYLLDGSNYSGETNIYNGLLGLDDGTVTSGDIRQNGSMLVTGADSIWNAGTIYVAQDPDATGALTVEDGGTLNSTNLYIVNVSGDGTVTFSDGATVTNQTTALGGGSGTASMTVTGSGTSLSNTFFNIGLFNGSTDLTISAGATVDTTSNAVIGQGSNETDILISGANTEWTIGGSLQIIGGTPVVAGPDGVVTFTVNNQGQLVSHGATLDSFGSSSLVSLSGAGSLWTNLGTLNLTGGTGDTTSLTINNGADMISNNGAITIGGSPTTLFTVSGSGSSFSSNSALSISSSLNETTVLISGGAHMQTGAAVIYPQAQITTTVTGAGSDWTISGLDDAVVYRGDGTLILDDGGTLNIGADPNLAAAASGTLGAALVTSGGTGIGTVNFNHTSSAHEFLPVIDGDIAVNSYAGTTILSGNHTYTEDTTIEGGRLIINGSIISPTDILVGGTLGGDGLIDNDVINRGSINPGAILTSGNYNSLTITGDYSGVSGSSLNIRTALDRDASSTDILVFDSGTVTGATKIFITNDGGPGGLTTGNGIKIVDAANSATIDPDVFSLGAPVLAGAYSYDLVQGAPGAGNTFDLFLRSGVRSAVSAYSSAMQLVLSYAANVLGTLHDRVSMDDPSYTERYSYGGNRYYGGTSQDMWMRAFGSGTTFESQDSQHSGYDSSGTAVQIGKDIYQHEGPNGRRDRAGLYIAQGHTSANMFSDAEQTGTARFDATSVGGYWTHYSSKGAYVDTVAQYSRIDALAIDATDGSAINPSGNSYVGSVEVGQSFSLGKNATLEPQAQVIYQHLTFDDDYDGTAHVEYADTDTVTGRIGLRAAHRFKTDNMTIDPWARVNVLHTVQKDSELSIDDTDKFTTPVGGTIGEVQTGFTIGQTTSDGSGWAIYGGGGYHFSMDETKNSGWTANAGLKISW